MLHCKADLHKDTVHVICTKLAQEQVETSLCYFVRVRATYQCSQ